MAIDLFPSLATIGKKRDLEWYSKLSEEDKKSAAPFVIARWLTGTSDAAQIVRINSFVNPYLFSMGDQKELLFRLLAASATGSTGRYQWIKSPGSAGASGLNVQVISDYYDITMREAKSYLSLTTDDTIMKMAEELGWDKDAMTKLKKEMGNGSRSIETSSKSKKSTK